MSLVVVLLEDKFVAGQEEAWCTFIFLLLCCFRMKHKSMLYQALFGQRLVTHFALKCLLSSMFSYMLPQIRCEICFKDTDGALIFFCFAISSMLFFFVLFYLTLPCCLIWTDITIESDIFMGSSFVSVQWSNTLVLLLTHITGKLHLLVNKLDVNSKWCFCFIIQTTNFTRMLFRRWIRMKLKLVMFCRLLIVVRLWTHFAIVHWFWSVGLAMLFKAAFCWRYEVTFLAGVCFSKVGALLVVVCWFLWTAFIITKVTFECILLVYSLSVKLQIWLVLCLEVADITAKWFKHVMPLFVAP